MKITKLGCHFHLRRKTKGHSCLSGSSGSKTQEEQRSCQQLLRAVSLISVCSGAAARQHRMELRGTAAFRKTVLMRRMFIRNMSADPSSEVASLLLPIGLVLTAALRRPFSSLSYVRNHLHSSLPREPNTTSSARCASSHTRPWSY